MVLSRDGWRRPSSQWCSDTAVRLLKISCGELCAYPQVLAPEHGRVLLEAAAILDAYGQALAELRGKTPA